MQDVAREMAREERLASLTAVYTEPYICALSETTVAGARILSSRNSST
jgi:hypothetical protein